MEKYKKYKDSGIYWLGEVPEHWGVKRLKDITNLQFSNVDKKIKDGQKEVFLCNYVDVYKNDFINSSINFMTSTASESEIKKFSLEIGDIMFTKDSESFDDIANSAVVVEELNNVVCGYHLAHIRANKKYIIPNYLSKLFHSVDYNYWFRINATGITRVGLGIGAIKNSNTFLPPLKEQTYIAEYLDIRTTAIDKKVNLLKQKIKHYKAYRKTLINDAVTKGLDKNVKLKESGINWIGNIPEHWEVRRLKDVSKIFTGNSISDKSLFEVNIDAYNYIATKDINIHNKEVTYDNGVYIPKTDKSFKITKKNTSLICLEGASAGKKLTFVDREVAFVNKLCAIKSKDKNVFDKYIFYQLQSNLFNSQFFELLSGLIGGVSLGLLKYFNILIPKIQEQQQIVEYLDTKTKTVDKIVKNIETQIKTLKELRKTLINDVVTGKVKVSA